MEAIALDFGTTAIKAGIWRGILDPLLSDPAPEVIQNGKRFESDAAEYLRRASRLLETCLAHAGNSLPLGISCQRSSFLLWDKRSGHPVSPLISWQDGRAQALCDQLMPHEPFIKARTGLPLTPYYFAPKAAFVLQEHPAWRRGLESGALLTGTLDSYLIWHWTEGKHHMTDLSMAARTLLLDIRKESWSAELCRLFNLPLEILPEIRDSQGINIPLKQGSVLQASLADQSAALLASIDENRNEALVNLGTGGFICRFIDTIGDNRGYLTMLVFRDRTRQSHYAVEGTLNSIGRALADYPCQNARWADGAGLEGLFCIAEPSGIGAPFFRQDIALTFSRPVKNISERQMAYLLQEGIIFRIVQILEDFARWHPISRIYLAGGLSSLPLVQQGVAACSPAEAYLLQEKESSLSGAARLAAGLAQPGERKAVKIKARAVGEKLREKYLRWHEWLKGL